MTRSEAILNQEFEAIKEDLIAKHEELKMRASGDWAESVENKTKGLAGSVWALDYTEYLEDGRKPGKFPPIDKIKQWIIDKPIVLDNITISSLAFLIARKISREGWNRKDYGGVNLVSEVITPARVQAIIDKVSFFSISAFNSEVKSFISNLATAA